MRTALLTTLALVLGACAGGEGEAPQADLSLDADTAEVLATSEATVARPGDTIDPVGEPQVSPDEEAISASTAGQEASASEEGGQEVAELRPVARFELRRGETLAHYARWSGLAVEDIAQASELDLDGMYAVGTQIVVPVEGEALSDLVSKRDAHHTARAEAYLASRGGSSGSAFVTVRTGDTAWSIAKDAGSIPVWLVESYNPSVDLERLRPGQELMVPVLTEGTVAQADEEVSIDAVDQELDEDVLAPQEEASFESEQAVETAIVEPILP